MMLIIKSISNIKIRISVMSSYLLYIIPLASSTASQPSHSCPTPYLFFFQFTFFPHTNEDCLHYYLYFSPYLVHCQYYYFFNFVFSIRLLLIQRVKSLRLINQSSFIAYIILLFNSLSNI